MILINSSKPTNLYDLWTSKMEPFGSAMVRNMSLEELEQYAPSSVRCAVELSRRMVDREVITLKDHETSVDSERERAFEEGYVYALKGEE